MLRGEEKLVTRAGRPKKHSSNAGNNGADKRDRGFDRGSIPAVVFPALNSVGYAPDNQPNGMALLSSAAPDVGSDSDGDDDPATRESVKASSRSKLATKKRITSHSAAHGSGGGVHHTPSASVVTGPPGM